MKACFITLNNLKTPVIRSPRVNILRLGLCNSFTILHVRTHASKSAYKINGVKYGNGKLGRDTDELPNGDLMTKQCF